MARISFLLPTFNRAAFIGDAIESIVAQIHPDDEILVVDDGSTDGTRELVARFGPRVGYVWQENSGKSVALNRGLAVTNGTYVMICDDDDVLRPNAVTPLLARLEETNAGFAFGRYSRFRTEAGGDRTDLGTGYWPDLNSGSLVRHILEDAFVMQNAAIVRRSAYDRVGAFDASMLRSLDYDMFVRLALAVKPAFLDSYIFDQRKHDGARGPAQALHAAAQSESVWRDYDRRIFLKVFDQVPLARYQEMFESSDRAILRRAALLQRACVNARHHLWDLAIGDLEAAADIVPRRLEPVEVAICQRILCGKHGVADVDGYAVAKLAALRMRNPFGSDIIRHMVSGSLWRLRAGREYDSMKMLQLARRLIGSGVLASLLVRRKRAFAPKPSQPLLSERQNW